MATLNTVTYSDLSGTITTGATAQQLCPASDQRQVLFIQNKSSGDLFINLFVDTATGGTSDVKIASGASVNFNASEAPKIAVSNGPFTGTPTTSAAIAWRNYLLLEWQWA